MSGAERIVRVGCPAHNCGGRCLLIAHIRDGVITRLDTDDRPDILAAPQLRACVRGRAYLRRQYHPDRLQYPLKRIGHRGEGRFARISWDEALDTVAYEMLRVRDTWGNSALFVPYGTGSYSQINGSQTARRLMNLFGGCLGIYNSYSWAAINIATPTVYGTLTTGNQRQDWLNARYILMWGWNPAEMRDGTNSDYFLKLARRSGARVVCIDPRHSLSAAALADEWIPIRPGTDAAMMSAMAYVMMTENLHDAAFVRTHCIGFDRSQMPAGLEDAESYSDYILGTRDGVSKTPEWAESITTVPRETIRIAREYATQKPGILYQGYGMQRRAFGEQVVRAGCVLAAITGNVGIPGGWASGLGLQAPDGGPFWNVFPVGENPVPATIPVFLWSEAVLRGRGLTAAEGVLGAERLDNDIKMIYAVASNALLNQHANVNRTAAILRDERKVEFLVVQDNFLTPTARFADLVLPACTQFETWGLEDGWKYGDEVLLMPKLVEPLGESRSDYRICADVAERLGIGRAYTEGRDERAWVEWLMERFRTTRFPGLPALDAMENSNAGVYANPVTDPAVAFSEFRADPEAYPLETPSGKIEIFSAQLLAKADPARIPAVPKYIQEWESPFGPEAARFPLQAIGHHTMSRVHSTHDNVDWLREAFPQRVFINPVDARARHISDGDPVRVYNDRGALVLPCSATVRIMPGVLDIPQGAWWKPGADGTDHGGCVNVLTSEQWTPLAFGTAQHSVMCEAEKVEQRPRTGILGLGRRLLSALAWGPSGNGRQFEITATTADTERVYDAASERTPARDKPESAADGGQYGFHLDAASCTGCKACTVACKDKNSLPVGVLWRRVYEVVGGTWTRHGAAWRTDTFAYNLSISCNHCREPICAEICPTRAITKRADGIAVLDSERCLGCRYCSWACPYGAPQFDAATGRMTKCDFCADSLDAGLAPSCVSACPMRALDFGLLEDLEKRYGRRQQLYPMPDAALTSPAMVLTPPATRST